MKELNLKGHRVLIDDDEAARLKVIAYTWSVQKCNFEKVVIARDTEGKRVQLHRWMMDAKPEQFVRPKDGNYLNCQRSNLEILPRSKVAFETNGVPRGSTGYRGVTWSASKKCYLAHIGGTRIGQFKTAELAAKAYDEQAFKLYGKRVNFPDSEHTHNDI